MNQAYVGATQRLQEMSRLAIDFLKTAPLLELYSKAISGQPGVN